MINIVVVPIVSHHNYKGDKPVASKQPKTVIPELPKVFTARRSAL